MSTKKGQVKFVEIFGVLIVFIFLVVMAIAFFSRLQIADAKTEVNRRTDIGTVQTANAVSSLSEIQCSTQGTTDAVCVDKYRYCALKEMTEENPKYREYYANIFGLDKHIQLVAFDATGAMMDPICGSVGEKEALYGKMDSSQKYVEIDPDEDPTARPIFKPVYIKNVITGEQNFGMIEVYKI